MVKGRGSPLTWLLACVVLVSATAGVAYAECGPEGGGGGYSPAAPSIAPAATTAGGSIAISAAGLTRAAPYLAYLFGACVGYNMVLIGPNDELSPDPYGNIAPFEVDLPADISVSVGPCSIVLQSVDGAESTLPAAVSVTSPGAECPPNPNGGLYEDLTANGCERNHMPSQGGARELAQRLNVSKSALRKCLPAIRMKIVDHRVTGSWGYSTGATPGGPNSVAFRAVERSLISSGSIRDAFEYAARDIADRFPDGRYNNAVEQARQALDRFDDCIRAKGGTPSGGGGGGPEG